MSATPSPVVVGIVSDQAAVVKWAVADAQRLGRSLRVVHSWAMPSMGAETYVLSESTAEMRSNAELVLSRARSLVDRLAPAIEAEYATKYGSAPDVLVEESRSAASLVVGSDDASWIGRVLGGEVSAHVGRDAQCPVIVIPEGLVPGSGSGGVVVAINGESSAAGPIRYAFEQADARGQAVCVLHSLPSGSSAIQIEEHTANLAQVVAGWQEQFPDVIIERQATEGSPAEACIDATWQAGLLVLGHHHGHTGLSDVIHPVAAAVLRGARCPVALIPLDYATA